MGNVQYAVGPAWIQNGGHTADSFAALAEIALCELRTLGANAEIVCGPISTGGLGDALKNFKVFEATIRTLQGEGRVIFNQMPFEHGLGRLRQRWEAKHGATGYCLPILEEFYAPLFASRLITIGHFIHGWESSFGARWEHEELQKHGAQISYLSSEWLQDLDILEGF
jgi:hypothetical protein